jgi:hypothetical protein
MVLGLLSLVVGAAFTVAEAPVPAQKPSSFPDWWFSRGMIPIPASQNPSYPEDYPLPDDFAALNLGQLKQMATAAYEEFQGLPDGAGSALDGLINGWSTVGAGGARAPIANASTDDFAGANLGQLKAVAGPFYDRLIAIGYASAYPWVGSSTPVDDFSAANLGQAKNLFCFDPVKSTLADGIPDWWKSSHSIGLTSPIAISIFPGTNLTYLEEYLAQATQGGSLVGDGIPD